MKYFIGIAPPNDVRQKIELFRAGWGPFSAEPHITVKAPNALFKLEEWLPGVAALCQTVPPVSIRLQGVGQFGTSVLYVRVSSIELPNLHNALLRLVNPPLAEQASFFEGKSYQPHLTLLHFPQPDPLGRSVSATVALAAAEWAEPTVFLARALRIYRSADDGEGYTPYLDLPLLGSAATIGDLPTE